MAKAKSRPQRWADACDSMCEGLDELKSLVGEYEEWRDNLPENLQAGGELAEKLDAVCNLDLDNLESEIDEIKNTELPQGFGRD